MSSGEADWRRNMLSETHSTILQRNSKHLTGKAAGVLQRAREPNTRIIHTSVRNGQMRKH